MAVGNLELQTKQPLTVLKAREGQPQWHEVEALVKEWQPAVLVVGEPFNMDGSDSQLTERARKFARRLHGRLGLAVELVDERLSSFEAKQQLAEQGHRGDYQKVPADAHAAALILATWLAAQAG